MMERATYMWTALVLLCAGHTLSLVLVSQHAKPTFCFESCLCDNPAQILCNATIDFELQVFEFNEFLRSSNRSQNTLVHFRNVKKHLPNFLSRMPVLRHLSLAENSINEVQNGVLYGMRLQELNLSQNIIEKIHPEAFQGLQFLKVLDLSHNSLSSLSKFVFWDLPSLEVLNLDFNQLLYFPTLGRVTGLGQLTLDGNSLTYLRPGQLVNLTGLQLLSLRDNQLQGLVVNVLEEMPALRVLDVSDNPLHCGCALRGLGPVVNSSLVTLRDVSNTRCLTAPGSDTSLAVLEALSASNSNCTAPDVELDFDTYSVKYTADVDVSCDVWGDPEPAVLWVTPWGHHFADPAHWSQLEGRCVSCRQQRRYKGIGISLVSTVSVLGAGRMLRITNFRSYFNGNISCQAFNLQGNASAVRQVHVYRGLVTVSVNRSMIIGGFCAAGGLVVGLLVCAFKASVLACDRRFGKKKKVAFTPTLEDSFCAEKESLTDESHCRDDSVDLSDEFYPPMTPFTTPVAVSPMSPRKEHTSLDMEEDSGEEGAVAAAAGGEEGWAEGASWGQDTPPGGWLPTNILDSMEEVRWRLRYGVGRRLHTVKRNVQHIKESSRHHVQNIRETSSVYVHNIMESGSTAANKVKAGVVMGMETVKYHVQSIKEFCGTGDMGTQTISMISVETNLDTNETREVVKSITIV